MNTLVSLTHYLAQHNQTVTTAESCTGGMLAAAFTDLPGSSAWFQTGWVTYSNQAKQQLLSVRPETLAAHGAVSRQTVEEMAQGALIAAQADFALSISGIAGPDGGSAEKPVGTVWFGLADKHQVFAQSQRFDGNREAVRQQAVAFALNWLAQHCGVAHK